MTFTRTVWPTSDDVSLYVVAVAPAMSPQPPPVPTQRCQWYANCGAGVPLHDPGLTVSVLSSCGLPEIDGDAVFFGADPVATTALVGRDVATPEPLPFVAVTCTRRRELTSAVCTV